MIQDMAANVRVLDDNEIRSQLNDFTMEDIIENVKRFKGRGSSKCILVSKL